MRRTGAEAPPPLSALVFSGGQVITLAPSSRSSGVGHAGHQRRARRHGPAWRGIGPGHSIRHDGGESARLTTGIVYVRVVMLKLDGRDVSRARQTAGIGARSSLPLPDKRMRAGTKARHQPRDG